MPSDKASLEKGDFVWPSAGYAAPAARPGGGEVTLPPGWGNADEGSDTPLPPNFFPAPPPPPQEPPPPVRTERIEPVPMLPLTTLEVATEATKRILGDSYVNLSTRDAEFMGHELRLSDDCVASIRALLGIEVCAHLKREQERILNEVLDKDLPEADRGQELSRMPSLPPAVAKIAEEASRRERKVRRVRKPQANSRAKAVRNVPGAQAGTP